jgi:hypothetical protein
MLTRMPPRKDLTPEQRAYLQSKLEERLKDEFIYRVAEENVALRRKIKTVRRDEEQRKNKPGRLLKNS